MVKQRSPKPSLLVRVQLGPPSPAVANAVRLWRAKPAPKTMNKRLQLIIGLCLSILITGFAASTMPKERTVTLNAVRFCITAPELEEYPILEADAFDGRVANVRFSGHDELLPYAATIVDTASRGVNYAGHYVVAEWGCGLNCQDHAVIEAKTGKIVASDLVTKFGASYDINSRLLILNPRFSRIASLTQATTSRTYYYLEDRGSMSRICGIGSSF